MREMEIVGVRVELPTNQPLVLLREVLGGRILPIWIGAVEASAIALAEQDQPTPRPLTHALLHDVIAALGDELDEVRIVDVDDGVFFAELAFSSGNVVDARPSDAIALALRAEAPVLCADAVLDVASFPDPDEENVQIAQFREFLETIEPEDFAR